MPAIQRALSSTLDFKNVYQNVTPNRPDIKNENGHQSDWAIQNAVGSMGFLIQLINEELKIVRRKIRERGVRMRRFISENLYLNLGTIMQRLSRFLLRLRSRIPVVLEGNAALSMEQNPVDYHELSNPTKLSLLDLARILMFDEVEDGVLRSFQLRSTPWESLPVREEEEIETTSISEFQLFNRPMTMEDDDERLSLPSTLQTEAEQKINSLETQLAALTRQIQNIMAAKIVETTIVCSPGSSISSDAGIHLPSLSTASEDEAGRCFEKKLDAMNKENVLPVVCPPSGPPPPPPPLFLSGAMKSTHRQNQQNRVTPFPLAIKRESTAVEEKKDVVRPSIMDLKAVQLRKTNTARSPGGTPMPLGRRPLRETRDSQSMDGGEFLANALRNKFRSVQTSFCEDEDGNSSWAENDDE